MMKRTACCALLLGLSRVALAGPLAIATPAVPPATFEQPYTFALSALGGTPPYQWCGPAAPCPWSPDIPSTLNGALPPGILLSANGALSGTPIGAGNYPFDVAVQDAAGTTQVSDFFTLEVPATGPLVITSTVLPVAFLEQGYRTVLYAGGGTTPYSHYPGEGNSAGWIILDTRRLPLSPNDDGLNLGTAAPDGLSLDIGGLVSGIPTKAGQYQISVQVTDSSMPPQVATQLLALTITPQDGLRILNTMPPEATLRLPYSLQLQTTAGDPSTVAYLPVDSTGLDSQAARASLPSGITLSEGGLLAGVPTAAGSFTFEVLAIDGQNRVATQVLEITVVAPARSGGCTSATGGSRGFAFLLFLAWTILTRRRRNATGARLVALGNKLVR
jgi:hypothetical protein